MSDNSIRNRKKRQNNKKKPNNEQTNENENESVPKIKIDPAVLEKQQPQLILHKVFGLSEEFIDHYIVSNKWSISTIILFIILIIISFGTRFYNVEYPDKVLFDEVHFVSMAQWYKARKYFFDIHPPLGKLCLSYIAYLVDFHTDEPYRDIGKTYLDDGYIYMRYWQAFWGSLLPPIGFLIMKTLSENFLCSFLVGILLVLELSLQTISRAVLLDAFLYSCMFLSLYFALKMWKVNDLIVLKSLGFIKTNNYLLLLFIFYTILCAFFLSISFSIKHTALGMIGVIGLIQIIKTFKPVFNYLKIQFLCGDEEFITLNCMLL